MSNTTPTQARASEALAAAAAASTGASAEAFADAARLAARFETEGLPELIEGRTFESDRAERLHRAREAAKKDADVLRALAAQKRRIAEARAADVKAELKLVADAEARAAKALARSAAYKAAKARLLADAAQ